MPTIQIGFNSEFYGIGTYDVFVSNCDPISWQLVFDDIPFSDFPVDINLDNFSITGTPCYRYYVSGDTGCYISTTATTENDCPPTPTPTPSITSSITPTPSVTQSVTPTPSVTQTPTPTPSTSQLSCVEMSLNWTFNDADACAGTYTNTNNYYTESPLSSGNVLYSDSDCTTPVTSGRYIVLGVGNVLYVDNGGLLTTHTC